MGRLWIPGAGFQAQAPKYTCKHKTLLVSYCPKFSNLLGLRLRHSHWWHWYRRVVMKRYGPGPKCSARSGISAASYACDCTLAAFGAFLLLTAALLAFGGSAAAVTSVAAWAFAPTTASLASTATPSLVGTAAGLGVTNLLTTSAAPVHVFTHVALPWGGNASLARGTAVDLEIANMVHGASSACAAAKPAASSAADGHGSEDGASSACAAAKPAASSAADGHGSADGGSFLGSVWALTHSAWNALIHNLIGNTVSSTCLNEAEPAAENGAPRPNPRSEKTKPASEPSDSKVQNIVVGQCLAAHMQCHGNAVPCEVKVTKVGAENLAVSFVRKLCRLGPNRADIYKTQTLEFDQVLDVDVGRAEAAVLGAEQSVLAPGRRPSRQPFAEPAAKPAAASTSNFPVQRRPAPKRPRPQQGPEQDPVPPSPPSRPP